MRVPVDVEQPRRIHRRVNLRGGQARMAEQLLQRSEVRAAREQMRREAVTQRVRCQAIGKAEATPRRGPIRLGLQA
jgi:hypothetical protein